ncbi:MAG: prolyl oligopeptidase family serine peptidase [Kofleriaceae bacterium]
MRTLLPVALLFAAACGSSSPPTMLPVDPPTPTTDPEPVTTKPEVPTTPKHAWPATKKDAIVDTVYGKQVADPYRWLEDEKSADVQAWMAAQDAYARGELAKAPGREALSARLKELFYYDAISAPSHRKGRYFYTRKHANKEKAVVYWKQGEKGAEKVLFDPNTWSTDGTKGLGGWSPTWDGKYVAYAVKENNSDETSTRIIEVATGKDLPDLIAGTKYGGTSWAPDGKGFYYTWVPPVGTKAGGRDVTIAERPGFAEVRFHKLGDDAAKDTVVHPATGSAKTFIGGYVSKDGHWVIVNVSHGWNSTDVYIKDARKKGATFVPIVKGVDALFDVDVWKDQLYITTNDGAPRYRVFKTPATKLDRAAWKEIIPQGDATLQNVSVVGGQLVTTYLRNAASEVEVRSLEGKLVRKLALPPLGTSGGVAGLPDEDTGYFSYTSFTEPSVIYKTSIKSGKVDEWARIKLPVDTSQLETQQVFYPSKDGTKISMFIISKKGTPRDGKAPTILYGYGGFNVNMTPGFSSSRAVWLERGGVYAIPNLRGGGEYGEEWHRGGMLLNKQNVFDDFIGAAEYLVKEKWTSPEHLAISGGSNGGLLTGAAVTQRPELFKAVIIAVPLLDMLRFHLSGSGKTWVPEYGSAEDPEQFAAIWAYSPYRRAVDEGSRVYPAILFDSADHDDRVDPMHARKLAAQLQAVQAGSAPILLRIEKNAGHGGADMVKQQVERTTDQLAWLEVLLK